MPLFPAASARVVRSDANRITVDCVVEYEQHGKPMIALVTGERKGKWQLINQSAQELELLAERLHLTPARFNQPTGSREEKASFLKNLADKADNLAHTISFDELWDILAGNNKEFTVADIAELLFPGGKNEIEHIATRHALLKDTIYFKRKKFGFEPRPREVVEELQKKAKADTEKQTVREEFISAVLSRLKSPRAPNEDASSLPKVPLPRMISLFEELAAFGNKAEHVKESAALLEEILERSKRELRGRLEDKAFSLLVQLRHFSPDEDLNIIRFRRQESFSKEVLQVAESLSSCFPETPLLANFERTEDCSVLIYSSKLRASQFPFVQNRLKIDVSGQQLSHTIADTSHQRLDLTALELITIDSATTKDIDDALSVEHTESGFRVGVHISDVASLIPPGSLLDEEARSRATSIYCPDKQIPMLPHVLSEGALSLIQGQKRFAISFLITFDSKMNVVQREIQRSVIQVAHRMSYEDTDEILYADHQTNEIFLSKHQKGKTLHAALFTLWQLASTLELKRISAGAILFGKRDKQARILADGKITLEDSLEDTPSHKLVSEMMILANESAALFAKTHRIPLIFRSQEPSGVNMDEASAHLPEGPALEYFRRGLMKRSMTSTTPLPHASLALEAYTQATSPIRRFLDLINQRQLAAFLDSGHACYTQDEVLQRMAEVEASLDEAHHIQRERNLFWLFRYLEQEKIKQLDATVVRIDLPRPLAELNVLYILYPFHAQVQKSNGHTKHMKRLGEKVRLEIEDLNAQKGILVLREVP